jgi:hypothetical protein
VFKFGSLKLDPVEIGSRANGILGIRDSGKTYTGTEIAEHLYDAGIPLTVFDPTGVWRFLRVPGKGKGRPVVVVGEHGDMPLNPMTAPKIVEAALQSGVSLVLNLAGDLSKADWRRIVRDCVRLLMNKNHDHGLRHVFIEEAAEFVPQRINDGLVYAEVERLVRLGGNQRLGCTLINQRSEEVNKSVLELCDNLFLHRQKGRNSLMNLSKWFDIADVQDAKPIIKTLATLPTGQCWVWLERSDKPVLVKVPPKDSFHPDRRVLRGEVKVKTQPVNVESFVTKLLGELPQIEAEFKANDPTELRRRVAELEARLKAPVPPMLDDKLIASVREHGRRLAMEAAIPAFNDAREKLFALRDKIEEEIKVISHTMRVGITAGATAEPAHREENPQYHRAGGKGERPAHPVPDTPWTGEPPEVLRPATASRATEKKVAHGDGSLPPAQQRILNMLAFFAAMRVGQPTKAQVALWSGVSPGSGSYAQNLAALKASGLLAYPSPDTAALTPQGEIQARRTTASQEEVHAALFSRLTPARASIMRELIRVWPRAPGKQDLAETVGVSPGSGSFAQNLGRLRAMGVLDYPTPQTVAATSICFLKEG